MAETFAEVPDGRHTVHTLRLLAHWLDPTDRRRPVPQGCLRNTGMARTFGTCGGDARDRMVRTRSGDGGYRRVELFERGNDPAVVVRDSTSQG